MKIGTYAIYKNRTIPCTKDSDFIVVRLKDLPFIDWLKYRLLHNKYIIDCPVKIPIKNVTELFEIEKEYLYKDNFYKINYENDDVYYVLIPEDIIEKDGLECYREPFVTPFVKFDKTEKDTIRERKEILLSNNLNTYFNDKKRD